MHGKTKSFFEDLVIIIIIISVLGYGVNYLFDNYTNNDKVEKKKEEPLIIESINVEDKINIINEPLENTKNIESTEIIIEKEIIKHSDLNVADDINNTKDIKIPIKITKDIKEKNTDTKDVDLQLLREFLAKTKKLIIKNIVYSEDLNDTIQNNKLQIRITILKNGNQEQLAFISGNLDLFKNNKNNILNVFPVIINDEIKDDFPRYLRLNLDK